MADFGKLNFAVSFNPQTAFPLDARYYFSSLSAAEAAAATAVEVGSSDGTYFYGENVCVVTESSARSEEHTSELSRFCRPWRWQVHRDC